MTKRILPSILIVSFIGGCAALEPKTTDRTYMVGDYDVELTTKTWTYNWKCWIKAELKNTSSKSYTGGMIKVFLYKGKDNAGSNIFYVTAPILSGGTANLGTQKLGATSGRYYRVCPSNLTVQGKVTLR